jgi:hypothetical protein
MFSFFKRKDEIVLDLLERINRCKQSVPEAVRQISDPLFNSLFGAVKSKWTNEHIANYKAQIQAGESHEAFIYNFVVHTCGDRLESGRYHIYRGILSFEGQLCQQLFEHAITAMIEKGEYTKEWADENLRRPVLMGIKEMG